MNVSCKVKIRIEGSQDEQLKFLEWMGTVLDFYKVLPINKQEVRELVEDYSAMAEWVWKIRNWGCDEAIQEELNSNFKVTQNEDGIWITFQFLCNPPYGIIKKLSEKFPCLKFKMFYFSEGWYAGVYKAVNNKTHHDQVESEAAPLYQLIKMWVLKDI